jgi:hypothetical protein
MLSKEKQVKAIPQEKLERLSKEYKQTVYDQTTFKIDRIFWCNAVSEEFSNIIESARALWAKRIQEYYEELGRDMGSCVIGAGFEVYVLLNNRKRKPVKLCFLYPPTRYQGSMLWERSYKEILVYLKSNGIDCHYNWGAID